MSEANSTRLSRRAFAAAMAAPALVAQTAPQAASPPAQPQRPRRPALDVPPFDGPIEFARKDVAPKVQPFSLTQVKLLPGPFHDAQEWNRAYMARLDAPRLLYNFRQNAGLSTAGVENPFGGWEAPVDGKHGTELRGHFTGHFLSASAQLYAATGDREAKAKGDELVAELAKCQQKLGGGYLSAFPMELFDRLDALSGKPHNRDPSAPQLPWAPFYTIHKIMAGMRDMHQLAGNAQALQVLEGMAGWADRWTASKSEAHMQEILGTEYGGMAEVLYDLAAITNNDQWARTADRYTKKWFFNPLALRRDELNRGPGGGPLHVNTHVPQVIGAARRYEISGDMRFHDVADYFWYEIVTARSYVTGGTSNGELWYGQPRELAHELKVSVATAECCCAYNMMKLTRHLYGWTADPRYFDYYERLMLNHRLGTILPEKGYTQYYLSLTPGTWKTFNNEDHNFWCCTGTGVEEYSKLADSIYWHDGQGLFVNQFIPSELDWKDKGLKLRQETKYPEQPSTTLIFTVERPVDMPVRLRSPGWLDAAPTVRINGRPREASASPGSYLTVNRTWKTGDRVELALPMRLHFDAMPDDPHMVAVLYGPLVLAGDLGTEGLTEENTIGHNAPAVRQNPISVPSFKAAEGWIRPADAPLTFRTVGQAQDVTMMPLNRIFGKRYSVYWQVS